MRTEIADKIGKTLGHLTCMGNCLVRWTKEKDPNEEDLAYVKTRFNIYLKDLNKLSIDYDAECRLK